MTKPCQDNPSRVCYKLGTTWYGWEIVVSQVDEDGEPVDTDLTGCTGRIQFRHHSKSGELGLEISGDDIEFDGDTISIAKRAPGEFLTQVGDWYGTLLMTWPSGDVDPVLDVIVTVTDGSTK